MITALHKAQGAFYAGGSAVELESLLTEDIRWTVPGSSPIAGAYEGTGDVLDYFRMRRELASMTFKMHMRDLLSGDGEHVAALTDGVATMDGVEQEWSTVGLYRLRDRQIAACWLLPLDPQHFDRIWSFAAKAKP